MIYGMLKDPVTRSANGVRIRMYPDVCPTCGKHASITRHLAAKTA